MEKWGMNKGNGPMGLDWSGCYPAIIVPWKDKNCREIDEESYSRLIKYLMDSGCAGLDPFEDEGVSCEENLQLIRLAKKVSEGKVPVAGKVVSRNPLWTWDVEKEIDLVLDAGADLLSMFCMIDHDNVPDYVNLYKTIGEAYPDVPIYALMVGVPPVVMRDIALACPNICAWKLETHQNLGVLKDTVAYMEEVEKMTGRHVCTLRAGDQDLFECLVNGAEGNGNGGGSWREKYDVDICKAFKEGDIKKAYEIQKKMAPATEAVRGVYGTMKKVYGRFPYRYKIAAWMQGFVDNTYVRQPRIPMEPEEGLLLRQALIDSGLNVVRSEEECKHFEKSTY